MSSARRVGGSQTSFKLLTTSMSSKRRGLRSLGLPKRSSHGVLADWIDARVSI
jgi:hypothetical protein